MKFEWETVNQHTKRVKVYGGWIVSSIGAWETKILKIFSIKKSGTQAVFVPDQNHEWEITVNDY